MRRESEWWEYRKELEEDRKVRARDGAGREVDPTEGIMVSSPERRALKGSGNPARSPLACADAILDYRPVDVAGRIAPRAMMWLCLSGDPVVPSDQSRWMYEAAAEPKRLVVLPGDQHYAGYERFQTVIVSHSLDWFGRYLRGASEIEVHDERG
jgi:hypothetical protein